MSSDMRLAGEDAAWSGVTTLHPIGIAGVLLLGAAILTLPRRYATVPLLLMACMLPSAQRLVLGGVDLSLLRILVVFGLLRVLKASEYRGFKWTALDWLTLIWATSGTVAYAILHATPEALVFKLGQSFDAIGLYFLLRVFIRDFSDVITTAKALCWIAVPVAIAFAIERSTQRNPFAVFGGVPWVTLIRDGRLRCQGAFSHPIMAGCFWASVLPLMVALAWRREVARVTTIVGVGCAGFVIVACSSSTPLMGVVFGVIALAFFPMRSQMRRVVVLVIFALILLHMSMQKPVWHLLARADVLSGSTGWHRYLLVDNAIRRFEEWAVIGTVSTVHWGRGMRDITNQYVLEGVRGGVATLTLFVAQIVVAFRYVGSTWRRQEHTADIVLAWMIGVSLFIHVMNFIGVSYFGQTILVWYMALSLCASMHLASHPNIVPASGDSTTIAEHAPSTTLGPAA